mgnify:CR=1 FL=1
MSRIKLEKKMYGYECPKCGNDDIEMGQYYCQDCGECIDWFYNESDEEYQDDTDENFERSNTES